MAERGVTLAKETARRIVRQIRAAEATPSDRTGRDVPSSRLPRAYRDFELTEELSGGTGATAEVKWLIWNAANEELQDSGETGEVLDAYGNAYGLEGERGEARFVGGKWVVSRNPGSAVYKGTFSGATTSSPANVDIEINGNTRTVSCILGRTPTSGKKYAAGGVCFVSAFAGVFYVIAVVDCEVAV
jgi:hypothetical protein